MILSFFKSLIIRPSKIKYAGKTLSEWHTCFIHENEVSRAELIEALKQSADIENETNLCELDVIDIFFKTEKVAPICLSIFTLSKFNTCTEHIIIRLTKLLVHKNELVRRYSALFLYHIGTVESLSLVVKGYKHGHGIRTRAAQKLERMGPDAHKAIPALIELIKYKNINWRSHFAAADALASIGPSAIEILLECIESDDSDLQYYSAVALSNMKPEPYINPKIKLILKRKN